MLVVTVWLVCGAGFYASARMLARSRAAAAGRLAEPSVVMRPAARLFGIPNAAVGLAYYPLVAVAFALPSRAAHLVVAVAATAALVVTCVLAADLLRARAACRNCWLAHACNVVLWCIAVRTILNFP